MSADELFANASRLGPCELVRGQLIKLSFADGRHGFVAGQVLFLLMQATDECGGEWLAGGTGFLLERRPDTVRAPDVAYIAADRGAESETPKFIPIAPDFCAEVLSPDDRASEVAAKVQWWLDHGVKLVWVVDPENRTVTTHAHDGSVRACRENESVSGGEVFPGLALPVARIFE